MSTKIEGKTFFYPADIDRPLPKGRWLEIAAGEDLIICVDDPPDNDDNFKRIDAYDSDGNHMALLMKFASNINGLWTTLVPVAMEMALRMFPNHAAGVED